jgi:hypothetical protein
MSSRNAEFSIGAFNGTSTFGMDDPLGADSNMANGKTNLNADFKDYMGKEFIPAKASISGMV